MKKEVYHWETLQFYRADQIDKRIEQLQKEGKLTFTGCIHDLFPVSEICRFMLYQCETVHGSGRGGIIQPHILYNSCGK